MTKILLEYINDDNNKRNNNDMLMMYCDACQNGEVKDGCFGTTLISTLMSSAINHCQSIGIRNQELRLSWHRLCTKQLTNRRKG